MPSTARQSDDRKARYGVNTNLEQISDWLTKIIVGLGLVELRRIPELLPRLGAYLQESAGRFAIDNGDTVLPPAVLLAAVVFFSLDGFFMGYLLTRLYLAGAFSRADLAMNQRLFRLARVELGRIGARLPVVRLSDPRSAEDEARSSPFFARLLRWVTRNDIEPLDLDASDAEVVGDALSYEGRFAEAVAFYDRALQEQSGDKDLRVKAALAVGEGGKRDEAVARLQALIGEASPPPVALKLLGYFLLWSPGRLEEAVEKTMLYKQLEPRDSGADFNLACAHAQLFEQRGTQEQKRAALKALSHAVQQDPRWKQRARDLVGEDFVALASDTEFKALIG